MTAGLLPGARVLVRRAPPEPHCRTPHYLRGRPGVILEEVGRFRDPSLLAFHKPGLPARRLFRVRFRQHDLWPGYGDTEDALLADLYEHWLAPQDEAETPA